MTDRASFLLLEVQSLGLHYFQVAQVFLTRTQFQCTKAVHSETKLLGNDLTQSADLISGGIFFSMPTHHSETFEGTRFRA